MKIFRLALVAAAAYGVKRWLDDNPQTKSQVQDAAKNAKAQAQQAADTAKSKVDEYRHKDDHPGGTMSSTVTGETTSGGTTAGGVSATVPTATGPNGVTGSPYQPAP